MSLLDRAQAAQAAAAAEHAAELEAAAAEAAVVTTQIREAVEEVLRNLADRFEEPISFLRLSDGYPQYVDLGGMILSIQPFQSDRSLVFDPERSTKVAEAFMVHAVGIDRGRSRLAQHLIGCLAWLTFEKIATETGAIPAYVDLANTSLILKALRTAIGARPGPRCGRPVIRTPDSDSDLAAILAAGSSPTSPCVLSPHHSGDCSLITPQS